MRIPRPLPGALGLLGSAGLAAAGLRGYAALVAGRLNRTTLPPPYPVTAADRRAHDRLTVVDLHADSLLWGRDLRRRAATGHLDLPRLREGGVALQVLAAVTHTPFGAGLADNDTGRDLVTALAVARGWPVRTWRSRLQRALHLARRLEELVEAEAGRLLAVRRAGDLDELLAGRHRDPGLVGAMLALEGCQALEGDLDNLDVLVAAGYRMVGLHHLADNELGGSAHGRHRGGLTRFGRDVVRRAQSRGVVVDVAHSSPAVVRDVLDVTTAPVVVSHTGLRSVWDNPRNLSDELARQVAATGGLLGITFFEPAVDGDDVAAVARTLRRAADLVGVEHLALGSDFDGAVTTPVDVTGLPLLTAALRRHGFSGPEVAAVAGGNALRVLGRVLPR
ncbi:dipeptidase [Kineococcus glutinatus]|uniref:Membrane dipeptidase n=1 Tax=Kineococcus glutinatus TaxID=1070872 RepID=A0ABP9H3C5_9ACTN